MFTAVKTSQIRRLNKEYHTILNQLQKSSMNPVLNTSHFMEKAEHVAQQIRRLSGE